MRAVYFRDRSNPLVVAPLRRMKPVKDQVLVRVDHAALNHRDLWLIRDQTQTFADGIILGSDACGVVEDVGDEADESLTGTEVVINPSFDWGNNPAVQGDSFRILGFPDHGTFSDYVVVPKSQIFPKPEHLSPAEASAVPLSGLTAFRALFSRARLRANEKVLITGIGGGAALWALQLAAAYKARVYVTSSSDSKIQRAKELGATGGFNYSDRSWGEVAQKEAGPFDVIIDSAGGSGFNTLLDLAAPGARIVNFGRTAGNITELVTRTLYWKQISILGTTMGTRDEFLSMLDFIESRRIRPVIDQVFPLEDVAAAFRRMEDRGQFGKILLKISQ